MVGTHRAEPSGQPPCELLKQVNWPPPVFSFIPPSVGNSLLPSMFYLCSYRFPLQGHVVTHDLLCPENWPSTPCDYLVPHIWDIFSLSCFSFHHPVDFNTPFIMPFESCVCPGTSMVVTLAAVSAQISFLSCLHTKA